MEASLIFSFILIILGALMLNSLNLMQMVEQAARSFAGEPRRYWQGMRPEDLIHLESFIREWIPR